jgi:hypothetical protein
LATEKPGLVVTSAVIHLHGNALRLFAARRLKALAAAAAMLLAAAHPCPAMGIAVVGDQIILSGPVIDDDYKAIPAALDAHPEIRTAVLRYSPGGKMRSAYRVADIFRQRRFTTGASGFCHSACAIMFLGGTVRMFTDDFPADVTEIGLHGVYNWTGRLDAALVEQQKLKDWLIAHTEGKADPALTVRWIAISTNQGMIHFFRPTVASAHGTSAFFCRGPTAGAVSPTAGIFTCEPVAKSALDLGIITTLATFHSNDR